MGGIIQKNNSEKREGITTILIEHPLCMANIAPFLSEKPMRFLSQISHLFLSPASWADVQGQGLARQGKARLGKAWQGKVSNIKLMQNAKQDT